MTTAFRALMTGVIDYAGLFPPAKLSLAEAVREFLAIRESPEAWMLGRFVIPVERVPDLRQWERQLCTTKQPFALAIVGPREIDSDVWWAHMQRELARSDVFFAVNEDGTDSASLELTMPDDVALQGADAANSWLQQLETLSIASGYVVTEAYIEVPSVPNVAAIREAVVEYIGGKVTTFPEIRFKIRTGGTTKSAFPTATQLAGLIKLSCSRRCPWKATAGLHHPLHHEDALLGVKMHGFLNVLFAAIFTTRFDLDESTIAEILTNEDPGQFQINDDGIRWRDFDAPPSVIDVVRMGGFQSFGSCSFDEPRDGLQQLGLL